MNKPPRLILWANDSPLNAVDGVCEAVVEDIERCLNEAEEDSCFVNDVVAYVRCLTGVYVGGRRMRRVRATRIVEGQSNQGDHRNAIH